MHIVKEADESRISKATQMAGEQSEKLADTIKDILALKGKNKLSVEIIEDAIDIVDGKKKPSDLIPCQPMKKITSVRDKHRLLHDIAIWFVPDEEPRRTLCIFAEKPRETWISQFGLSKKLTSYISAKEDLLRESDPLRVCTRTALQHIGKIMRGRRAQAFAWHYAFKEGMMHTDLKHERLSERRMLLVRNR